MSLVKFVSNKGGKKIRRENRKKLELARLESTSSTTSTRSTRTKKTGWDLAKEKMRAILPRRNKALDSTDTYYQCLDVEDKNVYNKMDKPGEGNEKREVDDGDRQNLTAIESSDFLVASYNGDQSKVELLLEGGDDVNQQENSIKMSGLMLASYKGHTKVAALLLEKGAHIDMQNNNGRSALMSASLNGHTEVAALLLERGAHIDMQGNDGESALTLASSNGHTEMVALLLEKGAHIDMQNNNGRSALMSASYNRHTEVAALLLERGAHSDMQDNDGESALTLSSSNGYAEVAVLLLEKGAHINMKRNDGYSALMLASSNGQTEVAALLLEKGAHIDMQDKHGRSALMAVSCNGYTEVAALLLEKGAHIDMQEDSRGRSALMIVSYKGHTEMAALLLEKGAHIDMQDNDGESALTIASFKGHTEMVALLLEKGAHIDMQEDRYGRSALISASSKGHTEVVALLLEKGAHIDMQDNDGDSALMSASYKGHTEMVALLLEKGAHIDMQDKYGHLALMLASYDGHTEVAALLLEKGAHINMQKKNGASALTLAIQNHQKAMTTLLLDMDADVNLLNSERRSALSFASSDGDTELVQKLLQRDSLTDVHDINGYFPLLLSIMNDHDLTSQLLFAISHLTTRDLKRLVQVLSSKRTITDPLYQVVVGKYVSEVHSDLNTDMTYPGILFYKQPHVEHITSSEATISLMEEMGISIHIPEDSLYSSEDALDLVIRPCFSGPFLLPPNYESASPAYLIHPSRPVKFQKEVTLRMHHYADLQEEEDCENMNFLFASPTLNEDCVYTFKAAGKGVFKPGDQVGEIALRHFCVVKVGKRQREDEASSDSQEKRVKLDDELRYSSRLYRIFDSTIPSQASAVFCMTLDSKIYIKACDTRIEEQYTNPPNTSQARRSVEKAKNISDDVTILSADDEGWSIIFDRKPTKILKQDILYPHELKIELSELPDYPPRIVMDISRSSTSTSDGPPPGLQVVGLDRECCFTLPTPRMNTSISMPSVSSDKDTPIITMDTAASRGNTPRIPNTEAESKEYITLVYCTAKLVIALRSDTAVLHFLNKEGFIKPNIYEDVNNPKSMLSASEKAGLLVTGIKDKVELNPKNYHKFVDHLRRDRRMYRDIVEILDDEYYS